MTFDLPPFTESKGVAYDAPTDGASSPGSDPDPHVVATAILQTVAYADVFDYPLTAGEIHRYLIGVSASPVAVQAVLEGTGPITQRLVRCQDYYTLPGREAIVETRRHRAEVAARIWPRAVHYGRIIAGLPFVRMVAVTGALAVDNVEPDADIDYLIVTEPERLWLCRALVILLVRLAARRGDVLCPNYFLSERALIIQERNLFTAHELVQMVPLAGLPVYHRMRQLNAWAAHFLPNAHDPPQKPGIEPHTEPPPWYAIRTLAEAALRTPAGGWLERWEMGRKVRKFSAQTDGHTEAAFCADWCKGHFDAHGQRTLEAFTRRLQELNPSPDPDPKGFENL